MPCFHKWSEWVVIQFRLYTKIPEYQRRECTKCGKTQIQWISSY